MCRNIRILYNFDPPATEQEIRASVLQYMRKISGFRKPSRENEAAFNRAVDACTQITGELLSSLIASAPAKKREEEQIKTQLRRRRRNS